MNCPRCGEVCRCHLEPPPTALALSAPDPGGAGTVAPESVREGAGERDRPAPVESAGAMPEGPASREESVPAEADDSAWREEVAARLTRYRSRRRMRPPRYPSLRLQFDSVQSSTRAEPSSPGSPLAGFAPMSDQALALDGVSQPDEAVPLIPSAPAGAPQQTNAVPAAHGGAKIIEFPRYAWAPPPPPPDQLAEPVMDRPRILEVPEVEPPPPALGGITIEPAEIEAAEKRPGIDFPLQSASFPRRVIAAGVDGLIVGAASVLFGFIFWKVVAIDPPRAQLLGLAAGIPCLFWAVYQYLLMVYASRTPGLRAVGLELARFDGTGTTRSLRRWRVLASYLSAASLGMGYVWVFLDEDALCWHDRITHTYLAPRK